MLFTDSKPDTLNGAELVPVVDKTGLIQGRPAPSPLPDLTLAKVAEGDRSHVAHTSSIQDVQLERTALLEAFVLVLAQYTDTEPGQDTHILIAEMGEGESFGLSSFMVSTKTNSPREISTSLIHQRLDAEQHLHSFTPTAAIQSSGQVDALPWSVPALGLYEDRVELSAPCKLFDTAVVRLMLDQIMAVTKEGTLSLSYPSLMSCSSSRWKDGFVAYDDPLHWFKHWVQAHPDWEAIVIASSDDGIINEATVESWSYGELNAKADELSRLIGQMAQGGGPVGLCMPRTLISTAALVAIFKSGRTYLPMDEQLPGERKQLLAEDSDCSLVITEDNVLGVEVHCPVLDVSHPHPPDSNKDDEATEEQTPSPESGAYVLYTSGSTGKPKGVLVGRRNLCTFVEAYAQVLARECPATLSLGGTGRYLGLASRAFDVHLSQTFMAWRFGMALVTGYRPLLLGDLKATAQLLSISHLSCVPSLLDQAALDPREVPSLVFIGVGGEKLRERVRDTLTALPVLNAYGPTETTIMCTSARVHPASHTRDIGPVLPGNTALVCAFDDPTAQPVLRGHAGELCIVGDLVAQGYLNRDPALPSGFLTLPDGRRLYRTGDAARMMPHGRLHYLGRRDEQAKIRGQRLEPGEVSQCAIDGTVGKVNAATLIVKHDCLSAPLLFTLLADRGSAPTSDLPHLLNPQSAVGQLARHAKCYCQDHLPAYMVPDLVLPVSHLTLLAISGKTDARRLSAWVRQLPLQDLFALDAEPAARGLTVNEKEVVDIALGILPSPLPVGPETSIFELGFDSLTIIRLARALREAGRPVPMTRLRTHPLIRDIAEAEATGTDGEAGKRAVQAFQDQHISAAWAIVGDTFETVLPCLPLQEGMVSLSLISSEHAEHAEHAAYLGSFVVRFPSISLDMDRVCTAAMQLAQRHAILRTSFAHVDHTTIAQIVSKDINPTVHVIGDPDEVNTQVILDSITTVPPWRLHLCDDKLTVHLHHALYDAHALPLLLDDLAALLAQEHLEPMEHGLSDLIEHITAADQDQAEIFWQESLGGTDLSSSPWNGTEALPVLQRVRSELPFAPLAQAAARAQVTVPSLVTAAVAVSFASALVTSDVILGQVLWGRSLDLPGAEAIVAPCLTTVPLALPRIASPTFLGLAQAAHTESSAQLAFQHTSLRSIRRWLGAERSSLTDVLISYLQPLGSKAARAWVVDSIEEETDAPAAVEAVAEGDVLRLSAVLKQTLPVGSLEDVVERTTLLLTQFGAGESISLELATGSTSRTRQQTSTDEEQAQRELTAVEQAILDTAAMLAQVDPSLITPRTPFLRVGIDSIVALRFAAQLRREHGLAASAHDVLSTGNIAALAQHLKEKGATGAATSVEVSAPASYRCTPLQAGMLSGTLASATHDLYVHHHIVLLNPEVEEDKLARALGELVTSRDILRTKFHLGQTWEAEVLPAGPQLERVNRSIKDVPHSLTFEEPGDYASPPWRAQVIDDEGEGASYLVLSMHHALYDGVSLPAVFGDLRALYLGQAVPVRPAFSLVATHIQNEAGAAIDHWARTLDGLAAPSVVSNLAGSYTVTDQRLAMSLAQIKAKVQILQVSLQAVTQLAWAKVLADTLGHRDVCFGQVVAGRFLSVPGVQVEDCSGPLINTVPIRTSIEPVRSNTEALQHVQLQMLSGQAYDHVPLSAVLAKWRSKTGLPTLFNTLLVFHNATEANPNANQALWSRPAHQSDEPSEAASEYPINVSIVLDSDGLRIRLGAPEGCMAGAAQQLVQTIEDLLSHPHRPAGAHPEGLAQLPSQPAESESAEGPSDGRVLLTDRERSIVIAALSSKLQADEETVSSCHNLFLLGLDSLLAIAVAAQARDNGLLITPHDLLAARTVDRMTRTAPISASDASEGATVGDTERAAALEVLGLEDDEVEAVLPTLPRQAFTLNQFVLCQRRYFEATFMWETSVQLDHDQVERAWKTIRDRHQVLRSDFVRMPTGRVVQVVLQPGVWHLPVKQVTVPEGGDRNEAAFATLKQLNATPTDFFFSTPGRLTHLSSPDGDVIMFTAHHAQYDPPTIRMLARELSALLASGNGAKLPPPARWTDFVDHSIRTHDSKAVEEYNALLSDAEATVFCRSVPSPQATRVLVRRTLLEDVEPLESTARVLGLGLPHLVTLAVGRTLAAYTKTTHPILRFLASGRACAFEGLDRLAGFTTISRPLSFGVDDEAKALETIQQALIAHAGLGQADIPSPVPADVTLNLVLPRGSGPERSAHELLRPLSLGRDSGFYTTQPPMPGHTAVDWPKGQEPATDAALEIDMALRANSLSVGILCSDPSIGAGELEGLLDSLAREVCALIATDSTA